MACSGLQYSRLLLITVMRMLRECCLFLYIVLVHGALLQLIFQFGQHNQNTKNNSYSLYNAENIECSPIVDLFTGTASISAAVFYFQGHFGLRE